MTTTLLIAAAVVAALDVGAVWQRFFRVERGLKPLATLLVVAAALAASLPSTGVWVVSALALSLVGDVALLATDESRPEPDGPFLLGVAAFLGAHLCYLTAFARVGLHGLQLLAGALIVVGSAALTLPAVLGRVRALAGPELAAVIGVYSAAVGAMATLAVGTAAVVVALGGLLFLASDALLARQRFLAATAWGAPAVAATYFAAQILIVAGLAR